MPKNKDDDIEFLVSFPPEIERFVVGDPGRIRQILLNLLSNATKFTYRGHVFIRVRSEQMDNGQINYEFEVNDTGVGIAKDKQKLIFEKFSQADASTTRHFGGTGLGLAICRDLIALMGGQLSVKSELGKGSCFSFNIELGRQEKLVASKEIAAIQAQESLEGLKLLVVDDSKVSLEIVSEQLADLGMEIHQAGTAEEALALLRNDMTQPFDLLLSDYCLPGMDGHDLAREIQTDANIQAPQMVLMLSSPERGDGKLVKNLGFRGYLTKPIFPGIIRSTLAAVWSTRDKAEETPLFTRHSFREAELKQEANLNFKGVRVLLAEDNPINLMIATKILERYECLITPAGNGKEALEQLDQQQFDIILMDCHMPEMDGFEATGKIRQLEDDRNTLPIIAFTANAMASDRQKCLDAGMDDFISKPVLIDDLEKVLQKWVVDRRSDVGGRVSKGDNLKGGTPEKSNPEENKSSFGQPEKGEQLVDFSEIESLKEKIGHKVLPIIECFVEFAAQTAPNMQQALDDGDDATIKSAAHSFKPICFELGATGLGNQAKEIEALVLNDNAKQAYALIPDFIRSCDDVAEIMRNYLNENQPEPDEKIA